MLKNEIAIVGIDSQFGGLADIDYVARALYVGSAVRSEASAKFTSNIPNQATKKVTSKESSKAISSVAHSSAARMLNALSFTELATKEQNTTEQSAKEQIIAAMQVDVIVVCESKTDDETDYETECKVAFTVEDSLGENSESSEESVGENIDTDVVKSAIKSIAVVSQLSEALTRAFTLLESGNLVALVGANELVSINSQSINAKSMNSQNTAVTNEQKSADSPITNTISFDHHFSGYQTASGFASVLLAPLELAKTTQLPIYAKLNNVAISAANASAMKSAIVESFNNQSLNNQSLNKVSAQSVSLVEVSALGDKVKSELESSVLLDAYNEVSKPEQVFTRAISSARTITGEGRGFSQVLGLLRTVIALQQRYIPGLNNWQTPVEGNLTKWQQSSFYFPTESRTWYPNADKSLHSAAYSCLTQDGYCHLVLTEHTIASRVHITDNTDNTENTDHTLDIRTNGFIASSSLKLVLVTGDDEAELQQGLLQLEQSINVNPLAPVQSQDNLKSIANQQYQYYLTTSAKKYTIALLAESSEELSKEIQLAKVGIQSVFLNLAQSGLVREAQWKTPKGSYFSADPVAPVQSDSGVGAHETGGSKGQESVCFMYPGIGATYVGLGRDLFQLFPEIYPDIANLADDIGSSLKDTLLNPRSITRLDFKALKKRDLALRGNLADIAEAGVAFACVFTKIFTQVFKLNADFATGYSMGEVSMYAALGCWQQPDLMSARLANSSTFNERLSGDLLTLRELWQLPDLASLSSLDSTNSETDSPIWETYTIKATLAQVEAACIGETRVFCTIINTPDSVLIGGYPADCLRVIDKLGVRAMPLNMANAIHSAPAKAEYDDMVALYSMSVNARINTKLYSSSCYLPVPQLSKAIAHSIAKCLCERVDFPRLVNTLYNNGARVFIEMGPGRSLCSWVDKTLEHGQEEFKQQENKFTKHEDEHNKTNESDNENTVSVPVNAKGVSDELTYFRAVAKLVSNGVKLELNSLFYGSIIINKR